MKLKISSLGIFSSSLSFLALCSCSSLTPYNLSAQGSAYLSSGTIVLSRQMPAVESATISETSFDSTGNLYSPVLGYIPPLSGIMPAENELWLEIDSVTKVITLHRGKEMIKSVNAQGTVTLSPGKYALQHKQHNPTWYATNNYFEKRNFSVPAEQDPIRFRRGALGDYALYPTSSFVIHCAPFWSEDVGGLRISRTELADIFSQLSLGGSVVVR